MATFDQKPRVECSVTVTYTEEEWRALLALSGYTLDHLMSWIGEHVSRDLIKKHGGGLKSIFDSSRKELTGVADRTDTARKVFTGELVAVPKSGIAS